MSLVCHCANSYCMVNGCLQAVKLRAEHMTRSPQTIATGWICPKCSRVYSSTTRECAMCNAAVAIRGDFKRSDEQSYEHYVERFRAGRNERPT